MSLTPTLTALLALSNAKSMHCVTTAIACKTGGVHIYMHSSEQKAGFCSSCKVWCGSWQCSPAWAVGNDCDAFILEVCCKRHGLCNATTSSGSVTITDVRLQQRQAGCAVCRQSEQHPFLLPRDQRSTAGAQLGASLAQQAHKYVSHAVTSITVALLTSSGLCAECASSRRDSRIFRAACMER